VMVELHWRLAGSDTPKRPDQGRFWQHRVSVSLAGTAVPNLPPEELLLTLCAHASKHTWGRLIWICDVAELLRVSREIDCGWVLE
ncbi:nucleotidyltransferase family protein, partial [Salmonella sp. SAL4445]|uniref:nucleotidyltransferase family protein n=1 Tax=Salmonella sp. SAL4445 TaxID=3159900 RepID=UPI00397CADC5